MEKLPIVLVRFLTGSTAKSYAYFVPPWVEVEKLDLVVVEARGSIGLGRVVSTAPTPTAASFASAYIISVVNLQEHRDKINALETV